MNRIPYLGKHMQRLNPEKKARKRFWLLLPMGYLSLGFAIGSFLHCERNALKPFRKGIPVQGEARAPQSPYRGHGVRTQALSEGVSREWVGRTRAGEPILKTETGISFSF